MKKYPSIEQFRNVIRNVKTSHDYQGNDDEGKAIYQHKSNYPILKFEGTIKLHGTNSSIVKYANKLEFQSRERVLSLDDDNAEFMATMMVKDLDFLFNPFSSKDFIAIFGEWCGGNIQKGLAINNLDKMFVIFGIMVDDVWIELPKELHKNEIGIYNIFQFPTYEIDIDFNSPELVQNKLIEMTMAVEKNCPVGKFFNKEGVGEGLVFSCVTNPKLKFKSKGEKHSVSRVKVLNSIDVELMENINEFVESVITENRLTQGISFLNENNISIQSSNTGEFLRWIVTDVLKEEKDTLEASGFDEKKVKNAIVSKAKIWFLNQL